MISDCDSDLDPDEIEVPGGGKDIHSVVTVNNNGTQSASCNSLSSDSILQLHNLSPANDVLKYFSHALNRKELNLCSGTPGTKWSYFNSAFFKQGPADCSLVNSKLFPSSSTQIQTLTPTVTNEADNEEEGMGVAETYSNYMPSKLKIGRPHPDPVVESTSLSSVEPVNVWYKLKLPDNIINSGALSALQLESITYACQQHERTLPDGCKAGFLIGDGAGVGKGRTIAGIIYENYLCERKKSIWISVMSDLKVDAERDLTDIGALHIPVYSLNKCKYTKLNSVENGNIKKGVLFSTYSAIIAKTSQSGSKFKTRLDQVVDWCGKNFDGALIFDECHKAKNLSFSGKHKSTKTGQVVLELQKKLPNARVVYASATGATEPKNMAYMVRLGIWGLGTPYLHFPDFLNIVHRRGVGAMEIVAMDMKLRGLYVSRHLSFHGVIFKVVEVGLTDNFRKVYDESTVFWAKACDKFREALTLLQVEKSTSKVIWSQFWSAHQRFFKYMCISAKVKKTVHLAREAIKCGKCVVIGLQSTGEARTLDSIDRDDKELPDFVSTAHGVLKTLIEKHFPNPPDQYISSTCNEMSHHSTRTLKPAKKKRKFMWDIEFSDDSSISSDSSETESDLYLNTNRSEVFNSNYSNIWDMKKELLTQIDNLKKKLPPNALDELIDELGGPDNVSEMTGRKGRIVHCDGNFKYTSRSEADNSLETMNLIEKQRFMDGEKDIAIISEAASSGISLHSDRQALNRRSRVHINLELPWSADKVIQQFGRTHRSNQVNAPEYILLISDLAGERRFASIVAKRLECLGALTQGDRRATEARDLSKFNIDNNYGRSAVEITLRSFISGAEKLVDPPSSYNGDFMKDALKGLQRVGLINQSEPMLDSDKKSLGKFLNRILGLHVKLQNAIFEYFTDTMDAVIEKAKKEGHFDLGILDVATSDQTLIRVSVHKFIKKHSTGSAAAELHTVSAERGMSWTEAKYLWQQAKSQAKFYVSPIRNSKREVLLAVPVPGHSGHADDVFYYIYRPNLGKQVRKEVLSSILRKYKYEDVNEAKEHWESRYVSSLDTCSHKYWGGLCKRTLIGELCDVGLRRKVYHILSGSVLSVWNIIEVIISKVNRMQVIRVKTTDGGRIVGTLVPPSCVQPLISALSLDAENVIKQVF